MNLKVLPLKYWMLRYPKGFEGYEFKECTSSVGREGYYLKGNTCWFELKGKSYEKDPRSFRYTLELMNVPSLSNSEIAALEFVSNVEIASEDQLYLLRKHREVMYIHGARVNGKKALIRLRKRMKVLNETRLGIAPEDRT